MNPRLVTRRVHAYLDYPVALSLIVLPFVLQLGSSNPLAFWLAVVTVAAAFVLTLFTDRELGMIRVVPYKFHMGMDLAVGLLFVAAPSIFGFAGIDAWYYWVNGAAVLLAVGLHKPTNDDEALASS